MFKDTNFGERGEKPNDMTIQLEKQRLITKLRHVLNRNAPNDLESEHQVEAFKQANSKLSITRRYLSRKIS